MIFPACLQFGLYLVALLACVKPLGGYMARVYELRPCGLDRVLGWLERGIYRLAGIDARQEMTWVGYTGCVLVFNAIGMAALYVLLRLQAHLPLNPESFAAVPADLAFNTAASFVSNTNWQNYSGESTLGHFVQMLGLTVQNFVSAATGMSILVALIRGLVRRNVQTIGNFWVDLVRSTLYILLPLSFLLAMVLVSQGVLQNLGPCQRIAVLQPIKDEAGKEVVEQVLPMGLAASQVAIKQLGTNGGGFFGANGAHAFENTTPLSNFLQVLAILLIPASLCYTFGTMVGDPRQGWAILGAMLILFVPLVAIAFLAEQSGVPALTKLGVDQEASELQCGGNMEGKDVRFGIANSALWAVATTAASNGSVNSMHDSYTPLGGLVPLWLMQLGEVVFGGVGSGLYGMLMFVLVAVFVAGLMVGRTPEYLGKKIEAFEMKMASLVILIPPVVVLIGTATALAGAGLEYRTESGEIKSQLNNRGPHGLSEVLYAFSSAGNNNGSAFAGLMGNEPFYNTALGLAMLVSRYWLIIPTLAIAGSLARKKHTPPGPGTLATHTPLFVAVLVGAVLLVGALSFVPAQALGPIADHLHMVSR